MSAARMIPIDAEDLLAVVRQSVSRTCPESANESAAQFVTFPGETPAGLTEIERLQAAYGSLQLELASFGSLPPAPPTIRGRVGLAAVRWVNRLFWWPTAVSRRFALAVCDYARLQLDQQRQQQQRLAQIEKRLHAVETLLSRQANRAMDATSHVERP